MTTIVSRWIALLTLAFASPALADPALLFPDQIPANSTTMVTAAFPGVPMPIQSATVQFSPAANGSAVITATRPTELDLMVLIDGTQPGYQLTFTLTLTDNSQVVCVGQITELQGTQLQFDDIFSPVGVNNQGDTVTTTSSTADIGWNYSPDVGQDTTAVALNTTTGEMMTAVLSPNGNGGFEAIAAGFTLDPGINAFVLSVSDDNCPSCGATFEFNIVFDAGGPIGLPLTKPQYIDQAGDAEPFQNPAINDAALTFGASPAASSQCCGGGSYEPQRGNGLDGQDGLGVEIARGRFILRCSTCPGLISMPSRGIPVAATIGYNSGLQIPGGHTLGNASWFHNWVCAIFPGPGGTICRFDARLMRVDTFVDRGDGFYEAEGFPALMRMNPDQSVTLRFANGLKEYFNPIAATFAPGRLTKIEDANLSANSVEIVYEAGLGGEARVGSIKDTYAGRTALTFGYDDAGGAGTGLLETITDHTGRQVVFGYNTSGELETIRSPVGPDFPNGRIYKFGYNSGLLTEVTFPNEVEAGLAAPRIVVGYESGTMRVLSQTVGGTNASGQAAGGTIGYEYLTRPVSGSPYTKVTDRNGNVTEYDLDPQGRVLKRTEIDSVRSDTYETTYAYTADGFVEFEMRPEGDSTELIYDDDDNGRASDRFSIGNVTQTRRLPGPRGGLQAEIITKIEYEPLFNKPVKLIDPRENDASFVPPFGAANGPGRYTTTMVYGYQEAAGLPPSEAGWEVTLADLDVGKGDQNSDGVVPSGCSVMVRATAPSRTLPDGATQVRMMLIQYNPFGQRTAVIDPGGVVTEFEYFPESDPSGTGEAILGGDTTTGGFLKEVTADSTNGSIYNGGIAIPIVTSQTWNRIGDMQTSTDGRGIRTSYVTNENHLTTRVTRADDTSAQPSQRNEAIAVPALSIVSTTLFDANDNVLDSGVENTNNNSTHLGAFFNTTIEYDILDQPIVRKQEVTEGNFIEERMGYDANQNQTSYQKDHATEFARHQTDYDGRDLVFRTKRGTGAEKAVNMHFVNRNGLPDGVRDAVDNAFGVGLAGNGNPERTKIDRDGYDRVIASIDRMGNRSLMDHDPAGNVTRTRFRGHPANDPEGSRVLMSDVEALHDESSRATFVKRKLFVDAGQALTQTPVLHTDNPGDNNFVTTTSTFDPNGRTTQTSVPNKKDGPETTTVAYDGHGRVILRTDAVGNSSTKIYNNNHQSVETTETDIQPEGLLADETFTSRRRYDAIGRTLQVIDPLGHTQRMTHGTVFMTEMTDAEGAGLVADPGGSGLQINTDGNRCTYRRDGIGRLIRQDCELTVTGKGGAAIDTSNPDNADGLISVSHSYLDSQRKSTISDDNGNTTTTTIDTRGNKVLTEWADGTTTSTVFNLDDDPTQVTDQNGNVITQQHDPLGRLYQRDATLAAGVVGTTRQELAYDGMSRTVRSFDNGGTGIHAFTSTMLCAYDSFSNKLEESHNGSVVSRTYKSHSDPVSLRYPDGLTLDYKTDEVNRLTHIDEAGSRIARFKYIGTWRTYRKLLGVSGTQPQIRTTMEWDGDRRLIDIRHRRPSDMSLLLRYSAEYNRMDYMLSQRHRHDGNIGEQVTYDSAYRTTEYRDGVSNPAGSAGAGSFIEESWRFDGVGNWTEKTTDENQQGAQTITGTANEMNEYTVFAGQAQTHDANGNRLSDDRFTYVWDFANRLRELRDKTSGDLISTMSYHVDARRTRKVDAGSPDVDTRFVWDGSRMLREETPTGTVVASTVFGRGFELIQRRGSSGDRFIHEDAKGWVTGISNSGSGGLAERYRYSAYGETTFLDGAGAVLASRTEESPWLYHGYFLDEASGQSYTVHRYHDPATGRWLSRDPLGYVDGLGLAEFCRSAPAAFVDKAGRKCDWQGTLLELVWEQTLWFAAEKIGKKAGEGAAKAAIAAMADSPVCPVGDVVGLVWFIIDVGVGFWSAWELVRKYDTHKRIIKKTMSLGISQLTAKFKGKFNIDDPCQCLCVMGSIKKLARARRAASLKGQKGIPMKAQTDINDAMFKCVGDCIKKPKKRR